MTQQNRVHIALLGDSIFDNASYTQGGPDVVAQPRSILVTGRATLLAVDGAVCEGIHESVWKVQEVV
ncbi:MAG: hypothetical protein KY445_17260 [Armatimonadetes bacterium]|nr:hypothetical protein [Armatimonadota bacterium]